MWQLRPKKARAIRVVGLLLALVMIPACSGTGGSDGAGSKEITIGTVPWEEGLAATYLWQQILQDEGYRVTVEQLDAGFVFNGLARGQVDLFFDAWPNHHKSYLDKYQGKLVRIGSWYEPTELNLAVPTYVTGVDTIADLRGKEARFSNRIVGIESGSELMKTLNDKVVPHYGLEDYRVAAASTTAMLSALEKATTAREPIVVTLWQPHWAFAKYPIKPLKDTDAMFGHKGKIEVVSSKEFADDVPEVTKWLRNFQLTADQLGDLELAFQEGGKENEPAAARKWIEANEALVDSWLAA